MVDHKRALGDEAEKTVSAKVNITLNKLEIGRSASVVAVHGEGAVSKRLMEMGVVPGTAVRVVKAAPFDDPIEIRIRGYSLAVRRNEAESVEVVY